MEYNIRIEKEFPFYLGYRNGHYVSGSCAWTKWGCKRNIKRLLSPEKDPERKTVETYTLTI